MTGPPRRGLRAGVVLLVLVAALAAYGDHWQRDREVDALLARAAAGQEAVRYADGRVRAAVAYTSPALGSAGVAQGVRDSLAQVVSSAAGGQVADLEGQRSATAGIRVLPWHGAQRAARAAYAGYLDRRVGYLSGVAADLDELYRPHPELAAALGQARSAYGRAAGARGRTALRVDG